MPALSADTTQEVALPSAAYPKVLTLGAAIALSVTLCHAGDLDGAQRVLDASIHAHAPDITPTTSILPEY